MYRVGPAGLAQERLESEPEVAGVLVVDGHQDRYVQSVELPGDARGELPWAFQVVHERLEQEDQEQGSPDDGQPVLAMAVVGERAECVVTGPGGGREHDDDPHQDRG